MGSKFRTIAFVLMVVLLLTLIVGCNSDSKDDDKEQQKSEDTSTTTEKEVKDVSLVFWAYARWTGIDGTESDGQTGDWEKSLIKEYEDQNPGVSFKFEHLPFNGGPEKVNVAIASNTQPDVLEDGSQRGMGYAARGLLLPFDLSSDELNDFTDAIEMGRYHKDGELYVLSWGNLAFGIMVNLDIFKEADALDLLPQNEERSWNFEEYKEALRAVSKDDIYGVCLFAGNSGADTNTQTFILNRGAKLFNDAKDKSLLNSPEGVAAVTELKSYLDEGLAVPGAETLIANDAKELFFQQKVATWFSHSVGLSQQKAAVENGEIEPFEVKMVQYPNAPGVDYGFYFGTSGIMAFKSDDADKEDEAIEFAKFMSTTKNIEHFCKMVGYFPTRKSVPNIFEGKPEMEWLQTQASYCIDPAGGLDQYAQIRGIFYPAMQAVYSGTKTPQEALDEFVEKANDILAE